MSFILRLFDRLLPALIIGVGVMLLSAGLLNFAPAGLAGPSAPPSDPVLVAGDPLFTAPPGGTDEPPLEPGPTTGPATDDPSTPTDPPTTSGPAGTPQPGATEAPGPTPAPGATPVEPQPTPVEPQPTPVEPQPTPVEPQPTPVVPAPSQEPGATPWPVLPTPTPKPGAEPQPTEPIPARGRGFASRVRISSLRIDLPVVSGDIRVRGNRGGYPLCDVAQYLTYFVQPGEPGSTYLYAHAQRGMFLPMLRASRINNGASMIGALVEVWTTQNKRYLYKIYRVKRHSTNLNLAVNIPAGEHRLVLQTSEGPSGTPGKLQVAAKLISVSSATFAASQPTPRPRVCLPR